MKRITVTWHPSYWATVIGAGMVLAGFGLVALAWVGTARLLLVPLQLPYAVSGGMAGLALIGLGAALVNVQATRHLGAREGEVTDSLLAEATTALDRARAGAPPRS